MSNDVYEREGADARETLKAQVEAQVAAALEQASLELTEAPPPSDWEIWARGPWQDPGLEPGRIIRVNEKAYIATVVFLNQFMNNNVAAFGGKIQLNYFTSNMQTMTPISAMDYSCCLEPTVTANPLGAIYVSIWEFEPTEAGCVIETNICARLCNCEKEVVPGYAGFVRWVRNFDYDNLFPPVFWTFDHPIRYLVYDENDDTNCDCDLLPEC